MVTKITFFSRQHPQWRAVTQYDLHRYWIHYEKIMTSRVVGGLMVWVILMSHCTKHTGEATKLSQTRLSVIFRVNLPPENWQKVDKKNYGFRYTVGIQKKWRSEEHKKKLSSFVWFWRNIWRCLQWWLIVQCLRGQVHRQVRLVSVALKIFYSYLYMTR